MANIASWDESASEWFAASSTVGVAVGVVGRNRVPSVNPGFTATDLNAHRGQQTVEEGAAEIVRVALQEHGPSGKFLETGGQLVW